LGTKRVVSIAGSEDIIAQPRARVPQPRSQAVTESPFRATPARKERRTERRLIGVT